VSTPATTACGTTTAFTTSLYVYAGADSCAPATSLYVSLPRPTSIPHVFTLPDPTVEITSDGFGATDGGSENCSAWTGTVTWSADVPNWKVTFDITCSNSWNHGSVIGTLQGSD
jgi:hypothetical protein